MNMMGLDQIRNFFVRGFGEQCGISQDNQAVIVYGAPIYVSPANE